jgi:hypothetical protein
VSADRFHRRFDGPLATLIRLRERSRRDPYCDAPIRHLDHIRRPRCGSESASLLLAARLGMGSDAMGIDVPQVRAFSSHDWPAEYTRFAASDEHAPLDPADLERWAVAAHLIGEDDQVISLLGRAYLYFLGLECQFAVASATIQGLDQDARRRLRPLIKTSRSRTEADLAVSGSGQR